jgi:adenine-specific DNA-methyltransferase
MRDLLTESGSIFVQIGDENVHRIRAVMDEVFGENNFVAQINFKTADPLGQKGLPKAYSYIVWYGRSSEKLKFRPLARKKQFEGDREYKFYHSVPGPLGIESIADESDSVEMDNLRLFRRRGAWSAGYTQSCTFPFDLFGKRAIAPSGKSWATTSDGINRLKQADRLFWISAHVYFKRYTDDYDVVLYDNNWDDKPGAGGEVYVVQTATKFVQRCLLMATDPGDLVLDPTCGSGTTATVAEQWGRRWITIDTSRVALALARARVMGAKYSYYLLADSKEGRLKEAELSGKPPADGPTHGDIRQGFVCDRAPHITLKSIANNAEIDVIWEEFQAKLEPLRRELNAALGKKWEEWEIPREAEAGWSANVKGIHAAWWEQRIARQKKIDESIAKKADVELLYDRPYEDKSRIRVAGPFTVESLSPHRVVPSSERELIEELDAAEGKRKRKLPKGTDELNDFTTMILEHLKTSGVQQAKKADRITFTSVTGWPGTWIAADGRFMEGETEKRAAIFIGPEFGTVSRADLTAAAREALDARFDALIACGFNFEAHTSELNKLGPLPILKAKMNPELHMSDELKNTGAGNLFVVFGEPDIRWEFNADGEIVVEVLGVDVFDPRTGEIRASGKDDIAAWFIDTDYNEESFFVRHAYFMGANDPYKSLKTALKAEIDEDAWATLYRDTSRPFPRPETNRFAVKVINHFGDEVMKVFAV